MRIHFITHRKTDSEIRNHAATLWGKGKLIPNKFRFCDGLPMHKKYENCFTSDPTKVTCKHCLKALKTMEAA